MNRKSIEQKIQGIKTISDFNLVKMTLLDYCIANPKELHNLVEQFVVNIREERKRQTILSQFLFQFIFKENNRNNAIKISLNLYAAFKKVVDIFDKLAELIVSFWDLEETLEVILDIYKDKSQLDEFDCCILNEFILRGINFDSDLIAYLNYKISDTKFKELGLKLHSFEKKFRLKKFTKGKFTDFAPSRNPSCYKIEFQKWDFPKEDLCELFIPLDFKEEQKLEMLDLGICLSGNFKKNKSLPNDYLVKILLFQVKDYLYQRIAYQRANRVAQRRARKNRRRVAQNISTVISKINHLNRRKRKSYKENRFLLKKERQKLVDEKFEYYQSLFWSNHYAFDSNPTPIERVFEMIFQAYIISGYSGAKSRLNTWEFISFLVKHDISKLTSAEVVNIFEKFEWHEHSREGKDSNYYSREYGLFAINKENNKFAYWIFNIF